MTQNELVASLQTAAAGQGFSQFKTGQFIDWLSDTVLDLIADVRSDIDVEVVVDAVRKFYDLTIRPLPLANIVDDLIVQAVEFAIRRYFAD